MEEVTLGTRGTLGCHAPTHTVKPDVNIVLKMMALSFPTNEMSLINSKFWSIICEQASKKDKSDKDIETTVSQVLTGHMY